MDKATNDNSGGCEMNDKQFIQNINMVEALENLEDFFKYDYYRINEPDLTVDHDWADSSSSTENQQHLRELCKRMIATIDSLDS